MAYDEQLADRVREMISSLTEENIDEKKMFGGLCFMINDKMCLGVVTEQLMVRLAPEKAEEVLEKEDCRPMDFTGKPMKGFVFVDAAALNTNQKLAYWTGLALAYNKIAKPSKKKGR